MSARLILHIGTTKTGSTSIQSVLEAHAKNLPAQGAYWPQTHGARRHLLLAFACARRQGYRAAYGNPVWQGMDPEARLAAFRQEFADEMQRLGKNINRVIISAEQFSELLHAPDEIEALHALLTPHFADIEIVVYLRRQDSHYSSMHAQLLRMGVIRAPDIESCKIDFFHDYDYDVLLKRWSRVFGQQHIKPRLFEGGLDVVDDFLAQCGLAINVPADDPLRERNPSITLAGQNMLQQLGKLHAARFGRANVGGPLWNMIESATTHVAGGRGWQPTQAQAQNFIARFAESNERVRQLYFPHRETLFDMDVSRLPTTEAAPDPDALLQVAGATMLELAVRAQDRTMGLQLEIARLAKAAGNIKRMKQALHQAISLNVSDIRPRLMLAEQFWEEGDTARAGSLLRVAEKIAPDDPAIHRLRKTMAATG